MQENVLTRKQIKRFFGKQNRMAMRHTYVQLTAW